MVASPVLRGCFADALGTSLRSLRRNSLSVIGATADKYERLS